jgi:ketosteroid isomerase-like protein
MSTGAIDKDIWQPFMAAYPALDFELAAAVYSEDLLHAGGPTRVAQDRASYLVDLRAFFDRARELGDAFAIEFRFTERIVGEGIASERGVFRIDIHLATGERHPSYGRFHVFERVENGAWRIVTDFDELGATAADFDAAEPIAG